MLKIDTSGTPFQRGRQQGEQTSELASAWMGRSLEAMRARSGGPSVEELVENCRPAVQRWLGQWEAVYPAGVEECRGLAAGLETDEQTYFTAVLHHRLSGSLPQCTLVGTIDGGDAVFGKTDDIAREELGMNVLEVSRPRDGYAHLHFHFGGTVWTVAGMNECGLAMGMTGIPGPMLEEDGLFSLMALHTVLPECADLPAALDHIGGLKVNAYGFSLLLADAADRLALLEKSGAGMTVRQCGADGDFLVHTNPILDPDFASRNPEQNEPVRTNGVRRYVNARALAQSGAPIEEILRDRSARGAICQQGEDQLHTDFAVVFRPARRALDLWAGYPAEVEPETVDVAAALSAEVGWPAT